MSLTADDAVALKVASHPSIAPRLLIAGTEREDLAAYAAAGGYAPVDDAERLMKQVRESGVRGRGGAAFPISRKIETVRANGAPIVVANGEEGEPASYKDRWLLRQRPHLVLDGLRLAALLAGTEDVRLYVSDLAAAESVETALAELAATDVWNADVKVTVVEPSYVAGEETAVVQALNGGPALPMDKPPRPFESGVDGRPTMVSNVETLANLPLVQRLGADGYKELGTASSPGTFLLTLTGCRSAGLYEVPFGATLRSVLTWLGENIDDIGGFLMGGYFAGIIGPHALDVPLDHDAMKAAQSGLGCGAVAVLSVQTCPVAVSAAVMAYFARENAGQCGSCFNGTAAMSAVLGALVDHQAEQSDVDRLIHWSTFLPGRGACGTLDGASSVAASLLREFPDEVASHVGERCANCDRGPRPSDPPYAVESRSQR